MFKKCFKCGQEKPLSELYAHKEMSVGVSASSVKQCLGGKSRTSAGFKWEYGVA